MNNNELINRLKEPFSNEEIEWKIQVTSQDKTKAMVVAYMDARAVQKRLDEVVGPFNWKNVYSLWQDNSQICGISIFNAERNEWVTKFDGAENSDIEPIKGGLSDSFKRAASAWGIGRYLYQLDKIWVDIEPKGKSFGIKQNQYNRLESEYNTAVHKIFGSLPTQKVTPTIISVNQEQSSPTQIQQTPSKATVEQPIPNPSFDYKVNSVKSSGKSSKVLELMNNKNETITAYVRNNDQTITSGAHLRDVKIVKKNGSYGEYLLLTEYKAA